MAMSEDILSQISMPALAAQLGTDEATARQAAEQALPVLLAGITGDAATPGRREALARAAADDHDPSVLRAQDPLAVVDEQDGDRIVDHVLRDQRPQVEAQLQGLVGGESGMAGKVLRMLAPLVMSWLAGRMLGLGGASRGESSGGGLGDVLGDVLGGGGSGVPRVEAGWATSSAACVVATPRATRRVVAGWATSSAVCLVATTARMVERVAATRPGCRTSGTSWGSWAGLPVVAAVAAVAAVSRT